MIKCDGLIKWRMVRAAFKRCLTSKYDDGSSNMKMSPACMHTMAMAKRCSSPPDRAAISRSRICIKSNLRTKRFLNIIFCAHFCFNTLKDFRGTIYLHFADCLLILALIFSIKQCTNRTFNGFRNLINVLWFDQCFQIVFQNFNKIILQLRTCKHKLCRIEFRFENRKVARLHSEQGRSHIDSYIPRK